MSFREQWAQSKQTAAEGEFEPATGVYRVEIAAARTDVTSAGTEMARITLRVLDGAHAGGVFDHPLFFSSQFASDRAAKALYAYGVDIDAVQEFAELDYPLSVVVGAKVRVDVDYRDGKDGKRYIDVAVLEVTERAPTPTEAAELARAGDDSPF